MNAAYYTYIMSNKSRRVYVGATSELQPRVFKHKNGWCEGAFAARYNFDMLVYLKTFSHPSEISYNGVLVKSFITLVGFLSIVATGCKTTPQPTLALRGQKNLPMLVDAGFQNAFTVEPQCRGITFLNDGESKADFVLTIAHDGENWVWNMGYPHDPDLRDKTKSAAGIGGIGFRPTIEEATKDVCMTIWDDLHQPYPVNAGGTVK